MLPPADVAGYSKDLKMAIIYKLMKDRTADRAYIVRGNSRIGTITKIGDTWHGRLRIAGGDAITAKGDDVVTVFDSIIDQRLAR